MLTITYKQTVDLIPYATNSRTHSEDQINQIAASIKEFGFTNPVLLKDNTIVAGHGRCLAAQKIGLTTVPTINLDGLTDLQVKAYVIADNKLAINAGWDYEVLNLEIEQLEEAGFNIDLIGFSDDELQEMKPESIDSDDENDDKIPQLKPDAITKYGDIWLLGDHRLMCADSTSINDIDNLMQGDTADMVFTDPPYGVGYEYETHDDDDNDVNAQLVYDAFAMHDCGKVWTCGIKNLARDINRFGDAKVAIWNKKFSLSPNGLGGACTWEPVLIIDPQERKLPNDVIECKTDREQVNGTNLRELHSCPKPVSLFVSLINSFSSPRSKIFEPFCGSGTTLIACEKTKRKCYATELNPNYCDVIIRRWQELTDKEAILESTGQPFNSIT